ncbi:PTS sugar transporter subunit IIC [Dellaglioa algida]|nr:PTS transporter subunit EIIC [Dellaglioa algida]MDK1716118.1 PTS transporter subunit EIIC [Dellaglioa algida]MDK1719399.1 PTS transporter subunit EIIC [Dellaglioa algida]MDK1721099.1 PTS transporter subunit EIIC [Dellaglioa algida]MDK1722742.1 PTS transporter subunit EIIC [Dellaglioa algida]MDK1724361.1 PTS transporter subunit EIIC [Dellaglioa algida]
MNEKRNRGKKFIDQFTNIAYKIGNQVHLRSLRDAFAIIMPLFILAGIGVLVNNVIFPWVFTGERLSNFQYFGTYITNGTLNIAGLLIAPTIGYCLAQNKKYVNKISAAIIALGTLVIMMPNTVSIIPVDAKNAVTASSVLTFQNIGTTGMFSGIIIGLVATELFISLSKVKKIQIHLSDAVPSAVAGSFNSLIPALITMSLFAAFAAVLTVSFHTDLISLITNVIQEPLRRVNTSLPGLLLIYGTGNLLFTFGIHQAVINGTLLDPVLLINMNKNMAAYAAGDHIPYIINNVFRDTFGMLGGTGSTICLLIATLIFSKSKANRDITKLSFIPSLFNINEPVIFGYPIVFNIALTIPFVLLPGLGISIAYFFTAIGWMNRVVVMVPWTTPPLLNSYLATGGDWRAPIVQGLTIVLGILIYWPFLKINERVMDKQAELK